MALLFLLLVVVAIGCGGSKDDRDEVRAEWGEPDNIIKNELPYYDQEIWEYYNADEAGNTRWFEFQKSSNSCGGGTWSLARGGWRSPAGTAGTGAHEDAPHGSPSGTSP